MADDLHLPEGPKQRSVVGEAGAWLALIGTVITVGQAGTVWMHGYWQAEAEKAKSAQELELAKVQEKSDLAQQYLKVILDKETTQAGRVVLYTALAQLDGHPLQKWAQQQYDKYESNLTKLIDAYKAQSDAAQLSESAEKQAATLSADIETLNSQIILVRDEPDKRQTLQDQLVRKSAELGIVKGTISVASIKVAETTAIISRSEQGLPISNSENAADSITLISNKVTVAVLSGVFPTTALKNVELNVPYLQAAIREFKISDKKVVAAILATIAVEDPSFDTYEEPVASGRKYESKLNLGNTQQGDGIRFRGRGYLGITGRANYTQMSLRLGLGTRLLNSPEDAKSPEVACRILVAWFADYQKVLSPELADGELAAARRIVSGSTNQLSHFTALYNKLLVQL
jgi:predicted chitinase